MFEVILTLGHCGGGPNHYTVKSGTKEECQTYINELPTQDKSCTCDRCGGYTGTNPIQEECHIEEVL